MTYSSSRFDRRIAEMGHVRRAEALLIEGADVAAMKHIDQAMSLRDSAATRDLAGRCRHRLGETSAAIDCLRAVVADEARAGRHLFAAERGLVYALRDLGDEVEADRVAQSLAMRYGQSPLDVSRSMLESDSRLPFHRWRDFLEKDRLVQALCGWQENHPDDLPFWPESFVLPDDGDAFERFRARSDIDQIYIVKPPARSGGKGIVVTREPRSPDRKTGERTTVVQRYIDRPHLLDGRKFHVRLHVLVTTHGDHARMYLHREGIVRIAAEPYGTDAEALARTAGHVTNTSLHRHHRGMYVADSGEDGVGNVWSLTALLRRLADEGGDVEAAWSRMTDLARSLAGIVTESGLFGEQAAAHGRHCFPPLLFGLDLLPDRDGRWWLLECQRSPSLIGGALVDRVVGSLGADALPLALANPDAVETPSGFVRLI